MMPTLALFTLNLIPVNRERRMPGGSWRPVDVWGKQTAIIICPQCDALTSLEDHTISNMGIVTPWVVCNCGFVADVLLDAWGVPLGSGVN